MKIKKIFRLTFLFTILPCFVFAQTGNYDQVVEEIANKLATSIVNKGKKKITVANFVTPQDDLTELGRDIASDLETALLSGGFDFTLVSRDQLDRILEEQKISRSRITEKENIKRIGQISNVDVIIVGEISDWGEQVNIKAQLLDVETANLVGAGRGKVTATSTVKDKYNRLLSNYSKTNIINTGNLSVSRNKTFTPIVKEAGDLKFKITEVYHEGNNLKIDFKIYNGVPNDTRIGLLSGDTGTLGSSKANIEGDMYFSHFGRIGNKNCTNESGTFCFTSEMIGSKNWINCSITFNNFPKVNLIPSLVIGYYITQQHIRKQIDLRNVQVVIK